MNNAQLRADAQREILNHNLRDLIRWCHERAASDYNAATTLTLLERKVAGLRNKLLKAGRDAATTAPPTLFSTTASTSTTQ
jgi:hypothetical protein